MSASEADLAHPALAARLTGGELRITGRLLQASNATFLATLDTAGGPVECVYKPVRGERPLWDFPSHTLGFREVAAYEASKVGGFDLVPVTVLAEGPLGPGSLQVWVEADPAETDRLVDIVPSGAVPKRGWFEVLEGTGAGDQRVSVVHADDPGLRRLAVFDVVINNADRKGGHILGSGGRVFGVDHGISFHTDPKLRTLLWGWAGSELTDPETLAVRRLRDDGPERLRELLAEAEVEAMVRRADTLLRRGCLPRPRGSWPDIPWPPF